MEPAEAATIIRAVADAMRATPPDNTTVIGQQFTSGPGARGPAASVRIDHHGTGTAIGFSSDVRYYGGPKAGGGEENARLLEQLASSIELGQTEEQRATLWQNIQNIAELTPPVTAAIGAVLGVL